MPDNIKLTILKDGTIRVETDAISGPNHMNAEMFLSEMAKLAGGPVSVTHKHSHGHQHTHTEEHEHQH
jgi:hypothetical protein